MVAFWIRTNILILKISIQSIFLFWKNKILRLYKAVYRYDTGAGFRFISWVYAHSFIRFYYWLHYIVLIRAKR